MRAILWSVALASSAELLQLVLRETRHGAPIRLLGLHPASLLLLPPTALEDRKLEGTMSIVTMVGLGIDRQRQATIATRGMEADDESTTRRVESAMEKISAFIPSEVIGIYVAGLGILSPERSAGKWWILIICSALIPLLIGLNCLERKKRLGTTLSMRITILLLIFGLVAFVAWAAALPGTPFLALSPHATTIGGWAVLILAVVMYRVADLLDIVPKEK